MIWETLHLYLRELTEADLPHLLEMMNGQRNFYERQFSHEELQNWLTRQQQRYQQNFGIWGVCRKEDDTLIGQAGLTLQRFGRRMLWEIGYGIAPSQRGNGYAKEAAAACLQFAFSIRKEPVVYAVIASDNFPSLSVAKAIGMAQEKETLDHMGKSYLLFSIHRQNLHKGELI